MKKMQIKALPFMIPSVLICFICMFAKTFIANEKVINIGFLFLGVIIGFLLILVHELLHAIAFPLVIFCFSSNSLKELNGILFGMSIMGMVSIYPDIYNIFKILKVVPKKAIIQNNKNETYYFE